MYRRLGDSKVLGLGLGLGLVWLGSGLMLGLVGSELGLGFGLLPRRLTPKCLQNVWRSCNNTPMVFQIDLLCSIFAGRFVPATPDRQQGIFVMFVTLITTCRTTLIVNDNH